MNGGVIAILKSAELYCDTCVDHTTHIRSTDKVLYYCAICNNNNYDALEIDNPGESKKQREILRESQLESIKQTGFPF